MYGDDNITNDDEIKRGVRKVIERLEPDIESQIKALNQVSDIINILIGISILVLQILIYHMFLL